MKHIWYRAIVLETDVSDNDFTKTIDLPSNAVIVSERLIRDSFPMKVEVLVRYFKDERR